LTEFNASPTDQLYYGSGYGDPTRVAVSLNDTIKMKNIVNGSSVNYCKVSRISYFSTWRYTKNGTRTYGRTKLRVPKGLLEISRQQRLGYYRKINAEAFFLGWLSKRLPESLEVRSLPPSNHKQWSDRTWELYALLEQTIE
jgi:hypothetical protein